MAIDKSLSQHYAIQGGGPNYLGKQKMVKAPKKWQSSPDHDPAELAYITKKEKDILIALDVHGSLKDGKPNRGPSGIISLQGDLGGYSGSSGGHDHGGSDGNDYQHEMSYSPPSPPSGPPGGGDSEMTYTAPAPVDYASLDNEEQAAVDRGEPTAQMTPTERNEQGYGPGGTDNPDYKRKQFEETGDIDELADFTGIDTSVKTDIADIHGEWDDPDSVTFAGTDARGNILYDPAAQAAATRKAIAEYSPSFFDSGIGKGLKTAGKIIAQPFLPEPIQRALSGLNLARTGAKFAKAVTGKDIKQIPSNQALINKALQNLTKPREINPLDEFGYKGNVYAKKPTVQSDDGNRDNLAQAVSGKQDVVSKAVNQFRGTEVETYLANMVKNDLNRAVQFYAQMTPNIGKASQQEKDAYELLEFYLNQAARDRQKIMTASTGGRVDKVLTGRSRDI